MRQPLTRIFFYLLVSSLLISSRPQASFGYAVLTHQAIIDFNWKHTLKPHLQKHFPNATDNDLEAARAYAYGGAIIQDMGYFPFSNPFYSDLTHYVRSGNFVEALIHDAKDVKEYAFALGALAHYCADTTGHPLLTNKAVAIYFPALKDKFGESVTYENDQTAHSRAEFGFDVLKVAEHHYPSEAFHEQKGFKVAKALLDRAFKQTYGIELRQVICHERLAIWFYSDSVQVLMPQLTKVTWQRKRTQILALYPDLSQEKYVVPKSKIKAEDRPLNPNEAPNIFDKIAAFFIKRFSGRKALTKLDVIIPTKDTDKLYQEAWIQTHECYKARIEDIDASRLHLANLDFDTGETTKLGEYGLADEAYAKLLHILVKKGFQGLTPDLKLSILAFYSDSNAVPKNHTDPQKWQRTQAEVEKLRQTKE